MNKNYYYKVYKNGTLFCEGFKAKIRKHLNFTEHEYERLIKGEELYGITLTLEIRERKYYALDKDLIINTFGSLRNFTEETGITQTNKISEVGLAKRPSLKNYIREFRDNKSLSKSCHLCKHKNISHCSMYKKDIYTAKKNCDKFIFRSESTHFVGGIK